MKGKSEKLVVVVNEKDQIIERKKLEECHSDGLLHRAIVIFIFNNEGQLLLTKRSKFKTFWPGCWDASCCTHVYGDETYEQAGKRRLPQELGFSCKLKLFSKIQYKSKYKNIGYENEMCALLNGQYNDKVIPNLREVSGSKWISINDLEKETNKNSKKFTPWLKCQLELFRSRK